MKQKIYLYGLITILIIITGTVLKMNHLAGAGICLSAGIVNLVIIFLPLALISNYRAQGSRQNLLLYFTTWLTCFVVFMAMLFKIQHWPLAGLWLTIALPFPYIIFLPVYLIVTSRNREFNINNTLFILLLLALNSVFSSLLGLGASATRVTDSYNLSHNYNELSGSLTGLPYQNLNSSLVVKIDRVVDGVNECQDLILKNEGITKEQWENGSARLLRADSRGVALEDLGKVDDNSPGMRLARGLKDLIKDLEATPGYEAFAKDWPSILDIAEQNENEWLLRIFKDNSLAWTLIYLDGLRSNLQIIKATVPGNFKTI